MELEAYEMVITRQDGMWCVRHQGKSANEIIDLFGIDTLPTPWSASVDGDEVAQRIATLNPGRSIYLDD